MTNDQQDRTISQMTNDQQDYEEKKDNCELCELCQRDYRGNTRVFCEELDCSKCKITTPSQQHTNFVPKPNNKLKQVLKKSYHKSISSCKMSGRNGLYLSPIDAEQIYNVFLSRGMHNIIDMLKDKEIIVENIDGSIDFKGGYIKNVYFKGMSKLSCKLLKLYLREKSSLNNYKTIRSRKSETSILDAISDVLTKSIVRTQKM